MNVFSQKKLTKPTPIIGVGLRHDHYQQALREPNDSLPINFVEVHAENFFAKGGATIDLLMQISDKYNLSLHGTSLGLGSELALPDEVLSQFADLVQFCKPMLVSEHLCFNRALVNNQVMHSSDLLPIAYNHKSLTTIVSQIERVQERIKRPILIENLSAYLQPNDLFPAFANDQFTENEFLIEMCRISGCGLLLDLNNLIINELNRNTNNPLQVIKKSLAQIPSHLVGEIHLAGYTQQEHMPLIIDDHGNKVSDDCWQLYEFAMRLFNAPPTLVEWDTNIPQWSVLLNEANTANKIAASAISLASQGHLNEY